MPFALLHLEKSKGMWIICQTLSFILQVAAENTLGRGQKTWVQLVDAICATPLHLNSLFCTSFKILLPCLRRWTTSTTADASDAAAAPTHRNESRRRQSIQNGSANQSEILLRLGRQRRVSLHYRIDGPSTCKLSDAPNLWVEQL